MASRETTPQQRAALSRIKLAKYRYETGKKEADERYQEFIDKELTLLRLAVEQEVREAYALKNSRGENTSYADLKRAYGTKDHATIKGMLSDFDPAVYEQKPQFELDLENKAILIHWAEIEGEVVEVESTIPYKWRNIAKDWKLDWKLDDGMKLTGLVNENLDIYSSLPIDDWERAITEAENENR